MGWWAPPRPIVHGQAPSDGLNDKPAASFGPPPSEYTSPGGGSLPRHEAVHPFPLFFLGLICDRHLIYTSTVLKTLQIGLGHVDLEELLTDNPQSSRLMLFDLVQIKNRMNLIP